MKPNIFKWAPSELSQDAFICWLLSWSNYSEEKELNQTSRFLVNKLTNGAIHNFEKLEIRRQVHGIDILCIVDERNVILIEDKVHTKNHGNQLERYFNQLLLTYSKENIYPVYFKTGDQSNFSAIKKIGYRTFLRLDFVEVLEYGVSLGIKNEIFIDYYNHLMGIENSVQSFLHLPVSNWHWDSWKGFYSKLQKELGTGEWDYVPQMNGGFLGFWWYWNRKQISEDMGYEYYLQLEHNKFCFKMTPDKREAAEETRAHFRSLLYPKAQEHKIDIYQNGRIGQWMTTAALSEPYIQTNELGILDMKATIDRIKEIQKMVDEV